MTSIKNLIPSKGGLVSQHPYINEEIPIDAEQIIEGKVYMDFTKKPVVKGVISKVGIKQKEYVHSIGKSKKIKFKTGRHHHL